MSNMLILMVAGVIGISLRMFITGEFDFYQLALLMVFPLVAILLYLFMRNQTRRDQEFVPIHSDGQWAFRLGNAITPNWKPIYAKQQLQGRFRRFYQSRWKILIADMMRSSGHWYLNLEFEKNNGEKIIFKNKQENKLIGNDQWDVIVNGQSIGHVQTDFSMKHAKQLKGVMEATIHGKTYSYQTFRVSDHVEVYEEDILIGKGSREKGYQFHFNPLVNDAQEESMLAFIYIVVVFYFHT